MTCSHEKSVKRNSWVNRTQAVPTGYFFSTHVAVKIQVSSVLPGLLPGVQDCFGFIYLYILILKFLFIFSLFFIKV